MKVTKTLILELDDLERKALKDLLEKARVKMDQDNMHINSPSFQTMKDQLDKFIYVMD